MLNREEIIKRCKKAGACRPEFRRLISAETEEEFIEVLSNNLNWVIKNGILQEEDLFLVVKYYILQDKGVIHEDTLSYVAEYGFLKIVKCFVEQGIDIHAVKEEALRCAAENGRLKVVKYLVEQGADIHIWDNAPLRYAAGKGELAVVKYLVEVMGKDIYILEEALPHAVNNKQLKVVEYLEERIKKIKKGQKETEGKDV